MTNVRIQVRRDTAAAWASVNPVLAEGEPGWEKDTGKRKTGNGTDAWTVLPYDSAGGGPVDATTVDAAGAVMNTDTSTAPMQFVVDQDDMASDSATKVPTQQSVKAYVLARIAALIGAAPAELDTWIELVSAIQSNQSALGGINTALSGKQPIDDTLTALAALATAANKLIYATGPDSFATADLTAAGRALLDDVDAAAQRATLSAAGLVADSSSAFALTADYQAAPTRPTVVSIGDSITANATTITTWNGSSASRTNAITALGYLAAAMVWNRQPGSWVNKGIGGQTSAQGLARFDADVTALKPQVVMEAFGTNDMATSRTAAACFADRLAMWRKAWKAGAKVIAATCPPRNDFTTAQAREACKLNALLRNFAAANPTAFVLVDWWAVLADPVTGNYRAALSSDGIHPNSAGAWALGQASEGALDRFLPNAAGPNLAADNVFDVDNLFANPLMTGAGGYVVPNTGLSGTLALGWAATSSGTDATLACALSTPPRPDGYGNWQQFTTTTAPGGGYVTLLGTPRAEWAAGDIIQVLVEFETDAAGWTNGVLDALVLCLDASNNILNIASAFGAATDSIITTRPEAGVLATPAIIIPPSTTTVQMSVNVGGLGTVRLGRLALRKLPTS